MHTPSRVPKWWGEGEHWHIRIRCLFNFLSYHPSTCDWCSNPNTSLFHKKDRDRAVLSDAWAWKTLIFLKCHLPEKICLMPIRVTTKNYLNWPLHNSRGHHWACEGSTAVLGFLVLPAFLLITYSFVYGWGCTQLCSGLSSGWTPEAYAGLLRLLSFVLQRCKS